MTTTDVILVYIGCTKNKHSAAAAGPAHADGRGDGKVEWQIAPEATSNSSA